MRWLGFFMLAGLACFGAACGRGVSTNPFAEERGGASAVGSGGFAGSTGANGSGGSKGATGGTGSGADSGSGGASTGGNSGTGGSAEPKQDGARCRDDDECDRGYCTDGVCCNEACGGVCERCDAPDDVGTCTFDDAANDDCVDSDSYQCVRRGACGLRDGQTCGNVIACASGNCVATASGAPVCCESECDGLCQACGTDGKCTGYPETDEGCEPRVAVKTRCRDYRAPPDSRACSRNGQCANSDPVNTRANVACGVGRQCDGAGECVLNGRGRVAAGERHTCIITDSVSGDVGNVVCWGDNTGCQLGAVFNRERVGLDEHPLQVPDLELDFARPVWQIAAGLRHTCVLFDNGHVRCWGSIINHAIGNIRTMWGTNDVDYLDSDHNFIKPLTSGDVVLPDPDGDPAVQISAGSDGATICAVVLSGKVYCWGYNHFGELGNGTTDSLDLSQLLRPVELGERAIEVRSGFAHTCVVTENHRVLCWGDGASGRLGYGNTERRLQPAANDYVDLGGDVIELALAYDHSCALLQGGRVRCWGRNDFGQLGYGHTLTIGDDETPADAAHFTEPGGKPLGGDVNFGKDVEIAQVVALAPSGANCALSTKGNVWCWGQNDVGELGYGHNLPGATESTPLVLAGTPIGSGMYWGGYVALGGTTLALAEGGRCALLTDGFLYCWGANDYGQIGIPESTNASLTTKPADLGPVHWWQ